MDGNRVYGSDIGYGYYLPICNGTKGFSNKEIDDLLASPSLTRLQVNDLVQQLQQDNYLKEVVGSYRLESFEAVFEEGDISDYRDELLKLSPLQQLALFSYMAQRASDSQLTPFIETTLSIDAKITRLMTMAFVNRDALSVILDKININDLKRCVCTTYR